MKDETTSSLEINPFSHIDLRVSDLRADLSLYRVLLPALGFTEFWEGDEWTGFSAPGTFPQKPFVGVTEDRNHVANQTRIAFWVSSPAKVDEIAAAITATGAKAIEGPEAVPDYPPGYYAVFFEDLSGNKLEVVHRSP
jgi:catechol 2,3-dioxygenase-like lactoylglutathione lyase family enzyme